MDPEPDAVLVDSNPDGVTVITINRPHRRNAVDPATSRKLYTAIINFDDDPAQKVAILTGSNGCFCAGADLHEVAAMNKLSPAARGATQVDNPDSTTDRIKPPTGPRTRGPMGPSRLLLQKPLICAVAGHAVAGGLELSLLGDMRVIEEDAVLGVFCRRWGVPLIDGGTVRLPAIVGLGRALDLILTGRPVGAQEALAMGLANRVVPKGQALAEAKKIAQQLVAFPQACMRADRASAYHAAFDARSFGDAISNEWDKGFPVVELEGVQGAAGFSKGAGRHGDFSSFGKGKL
ncbi:carnitinyl-CoA dehydratase [Microdochium trichocladiopsis]|uniref:Carnitinyl-CoA dehydratase n=1 Tax=Microdochium trichocladiopsis TaxID=1682393 RepID=A0A9P8YGX2_9PEZI|nr:carnitinyl-CoA dehydratase [Microdochium trichocladiopsis]KAH7041492.1 carnitinyl-CoA dehydratase [Microdochium trichocladiopsis]